MDERPYSEIERSDSSRGIPFISISSGMVTRRSISSEAWPGHCVINSTCGGDKSGYASIGSFWKEMTPQAIRARAAMITTNGCRRAKETRRPIMGLLGTVGELEEQAAAGDYDISGLEPAGNRDQAIP